MNAPGASTAKRSTRAAAAPAPDTLTPADRYQELFVAVQSGRVFADSKTFVDCAPRAEPEAILAAYRAQCGEPGFDLAAFVQANFELVEPAPSDYVSVPGQPIAAHIADLWPVLTRHPQVHPPRSSLLQLPHPYVVPGGRFRELYYWDSYFTLLGLSGEHHRPLVRGMVENFAFLIDTHGHVPNGTRSYYLGRSQPPVFALMVELAQQQGAVDAIDFLPQLRREHAWWMAGSEGLAPGDASRRVVRLAGGALLNRYWDERDTPREESWIEDVATAQACDREPALIYRDIRAACESGWDFSTRWMREPPPPGDVQPCAHVRAATAASLASLCTTDILPVDLNAFLHQLECTLATLSGQAGDAAAAQAYSQQAEARRDAIGECFWDPQQGAFFDHDWRRGVRRSCLTAASVVPLFVGLATAAQAEALAETVSQRLLAHGGLSTTECGSDQQWDRPNGWAALQWMAVRGLADYGHEALSRTIARRWLATVAALYEREGKLVEKYALRRVERDDTAGGAGGEYPLQDGFGWTNGVTAALLAEHPQHTAHGCVAHAAAPQHR
ncbi:MULTISPECIES: alpha,alpha-trehalase TreF [Variovorax]|uniref:Alpha,alpha-trehalase TreF n=1 Tax=Variovorax ginsengisoli TaxID=363844 RepID=A0ABT8RYM2_9BURK|nr:MULTISPECIES: alpha,alpha-trehalase TreF [Variovorax]MDM0082980.1 alpha,alpha-trehalase TreF [Variovorax sp. J31P179]MDN8612340.1 alpha,alpha-trehalase TreF [Variovorax ginsengisoli]MDO1531510.1 alpha,alpha-trehalase TreF [Variovorax ginsengisoli]